MKSTACLATGAGQSRQPQETVIMRHRALQLLLEPKPVVIPFASRLVELLPSERIEMRRIVPQILGMIQTSALLHQRQRVEDADGRIVATLADYRLTRSLLQEAVSKRLGMAVSPPAERFLDRLQDKVGGGLQFTTDQAPRGESVTDRSVREWLHELERAGRVGTVTAGRGGRSSVWILCGRCQTKKGALPDRLHD
jgi:hypothetical protein